MFKKFVVFTLLVLLHADLFSAAAQDARIAQVKFSLTDFRNPSSVRGRFGLLQFSRDGRLLATTGTDRALKIYDVEAGKLKTTIDSKKAGLAGKLGYNAFSFSPDGKKAIAQEETYASPKVFETETGNLVRTIDGRGKVSSAKMQQATMLSGLEGLEMIGVASDPDWRNILVAKNEGLFEIVDIESGKVRQTLAHGGKENAAWEFVKFFFTNDLPAPLPFLISSGRFSADGKKIVISDGGKEFPTLWDAETGQQIAKLGPQTDRVYRAFFSPDSLLVVTSDDNGVTSVFNGGDGTLVESLVSNTDLTLAAACNDKSDRVVTLSPKADARVWDARSGKLLFNLEKSQATNVSLSPDGRLIATIHRDDKKQMAQIWNAADGRLIATLPRGKSDDRAFSLQWSPDSRLLVTASSDLVKLWSSDGRLLQTLENAVFPTRFSEDGSMLATGGKNDVGFVWQISRN